MIDIISKSDLILKLEEICPKEVYLFDRGNTSKDHINIDFISEKRSYADNGVYTTSSLLQISFFTKDKMNIFKYKKFFIENFRANLIINYDYNNNWHVENYETVIKITDWDI